MENRKRTDIMVWKEFQEKLEQDLITEFRDGGIFAATVMW